MTAWQERAQSDYIRRNAIFSSKIAPQVEIQHGCFVSEDFGTMNGQWVRARAYIYAQKGKAQNMT